MGVPAVVMNDQVKGICTIHLMPGPSGTQPAGPRTFSAQLLQGLSPTVLIGGKPAAIQGSWGLNTLPTHAGLSDAYMAPNLQKGTLLTGSMTVLFDGTPAATSSSMCTMCVEPGQVVSSVTSVLIGG